MGIQAALLYKDSTLCVSQQLYCTNAVLYGYPSSPTVQGQYPMGIPAALMYKDITIWVSQQPFWARTMSILSALPYKDSTLWVSQQPLCTSPLPYAHPSSPTVQVQYPIGIPAALMNKVRALSIFQQP